MQLLQGISERDRRQHVVVQVGDRLTDAPFALVEPQGGKILTKQLGTDPDRGEELVGAATAVLPTVQEDDGMGIPLDHSGPEPMVVGLGPTGYVAKGSGVDHDPPKPLP
jgi:hypothetical protein